MTPVELFKTLRETGDQLAGMLAELSHWRVIGMAIGRLEGRMPGVGAEIQREVAAIQAEAAEQQRRQGNYGSTGGAAAASGEIESADGSASAASSDGVTGD